MKKIVSVFLSILLIISLSVTAFAEGDPNLDGGGGGMGSGTSTNSWTPGRDGVRITVVRTSDNQAVSTPVDFTNGNTSDIQIHFGEVSKIGYRSGQALTPQIGGYYSIKPAQSMPTIVSSSGSNNIPAIRNYFCLSGTIQDIASATGFSYDLLISGEYKILLEPIAYV